MKSTTTLKWLGLSLGMSLFAGCAMTGMNTRTGGGWYAHYKEGLTATPNTQSTKTGKSCSKNIIGISSGDSSIEAAKKSGGITRVATVDSEIQNYFGVYGKHCIVVAGE